MTKAKKTQLLEALKDYHFEKRFVAKTNERIARVAANLSLEDFDADYLRNLIVSRSDAMELERNAFEKACELLCSETKLGQTKAGRDLAVRLVNRETLADIADLAEFIDLAF